MKNKNLKQALRYIVSIALLFLVSVKMSAQCSDVTLSLTGKNSTCMANGSIKVVISGPDVVNIRQSDMQFQVSILGNVYKSWATYPNDSITNLPAGTYTIGLRAFCFSENKYVVFNTSATTTLTSSYTEMNVVAGLPRATLNCIYTGMIPITIMNNTGSPPFTITMTNYPGTYAGTKTFVTSTRGTPYQIQNLPAGNYTFTVSDDCSYSRIINATVGTMAQDFDTRMIDDYLYSPTAPLPGQCDIVTFQNPINGNYTSDERHYFFDNIRDYYQIAFLVNNIGTPVYMNIPSGQYFNWQLPSQTIRWLRDNNATISVYLSIKGTSCWQLLKSVGISLPNNFFSFSDIGCDSLTVSHYPYNSLSGRLICYPYRWRVFRSDNTPFLGWSNWISDYSTQVVRVPLGAWIEYEDSNLDSFGDGYTWSKWTPSSPLSVTGVSSGLGAYITNGINADSTYKSFMYIFVPNSGIFPAGTRFEYVSASGPKTPIHTDTTIIAPISYFYPFSPNYTTNFYDSIPAGVYQFIVTIPGCLPQPITINHINNKIVTPFSYTTKETCGGLYVFPSGQLGQVTTIGTVNNIATYYQLFSVVPSSIPINTRIISAGDSLFLPTTGMYMIGMNFSNVSTFVSWLDTIYYTQTPFSLDPDMISSYVCEDTNQGFIRVAGMGGSGNYEYELWDAGTLIAQNTSGVFNYGSVNANYTIRLIDTDPACAASYDQVVNMIDLGIAQIAYSSDPTNTFCLSDSIYLKCLTLGETTYTWDGPGITSANENLQNPAIFAEDIGIGTFTYTITVTPEGCGQEMEQTVTVTVEDCTGARDDYLTLFVNTTDSVDVLANDSYPASCIASVIPVITVNPTQGIASVVNNKVVYTPNTDFIGRDSLTYTTVCGTIVTSAKVYFIVIEMPDNISDADCIVFPRPTGEWSIKNRFSSDTINGGDVFEMSVPLVGDIDNDGIIEIVCAGRSLTTGTFICDSIKVFNGLTGAIKYKFPVERFHAGFGTIAIADVEGDGYAEIFVATHAEATAGNRGHIFCYTHDGIVNWKSNVPYTADSTSLAFPYMKIMDFDGDGIPEIIANDRIFNAVTGQLLLDCGLIAGGLDYGTGAGHNSYLPAAPAGTSYFGNFSSAVDMDGDGLPELVAGRNIYKISLNDLTNPSLNTCTILRSAIPDLHTELGDGYTSVADLDLDGTPDVIVIRQNPASRATKYLYAWSGKTGEMLHANIVSVSDGNGSYGGSIPFIGDLDGDGVPEISFTVSRSLHAYKYNSVDSLLPMSWSPLATTDGSGATTLTLFDFDQDDKMELVYRDEQDLRIIDGTTGNEKARKSCNSWTMNEYPVIADVTGGGYANIVVLGKPAYAPHGNGYLYVFEHDLSVPGAIPWAPTRKVWNQWAYNAVNINEDLTVPVFQMNPATVFPGVDGIFGTSDDVRPFNGFLMQQTKLNKFGNPLWLLPDVTPVLSLSSVIHNDVSVTLTINVLNQGDAAIGAPVYITLYKDLASPAIMTVAAPVMILPGESETVTVTILSITPYQPIDRIFARINDNGLTFPIEEECDATNNVIIFPLMKKYAYLNSSSNPDNGLYGNPVSALYSDVITYQLTAINTGNTNATGTIIDTIPLYLDYITGAAAITPISTNPPRQVASWNITVPPGATHTESYQAKPKQGVSVSQPLFINKAWVTLNNISYPTNETYHQGAGAGYVTFLTSLGGSIYNADMQAVDYSLSPKSGVIIVPDEGYSFAGWSHEEYISLRGEVIPAKSGIMRYDTLAIYGNVTLRANFVPDDNPFKKGDETVVEQPVSEENLLWTVGNELFIKTSKLNAIVRIYTLDGVLQKQQIILQAGESKIQLQDGMYVVTINNGIGQKIRISSH